MTEERFHFLLEQYVTDMINEEDRKEFHSLLEDPFYREVFEKVMEEEWNEGRYEEQKNDRIGQMIEQNVMEKIRGVKVVPIQRASVLWIRRVAAVAVLIMLAVGAYYWVSRDGFQEKARTAKASNSGNEGTSGSNKALLTLNGGEKIVLDVAESGTLARQGGTRLDKKGDGTLVYEVESKTAGPLFNVVSTFKGGQSHLKLADGTEVWLNAASSVRFPTAFAGNSRSVEITGEAYFEVAHEPAKPFKVSVKGMQVEVLGTHFNINAYPDEAISKTTLLQGKIKISNDKESAILNPGEQARLSSAKRMSIVKNADTEEALAWKNGYFIFRETEIVTVMKQLQRWYDVEIIYERGLPQGHYNGEISRKMNLSQLVRILNAGEIKCKLEGKKIIVAP